MQRFRRLRKNEVIRGMMQETRLHPKDFIYPIFVAEGENLENPVASMPGVFQYSLDRLDGILKKGALLKQKKGGSRIGPRPHHRLWQRGSILFPIFPCRP